MDIGTGIFAGGAVVAGAALFIATKSKWNWRRGLVRGFLAIVCAIPIMWFSSWAWTMYSERPLKQSELWNLKIGESLQDVRFKKGAPNDEKNPESGLSYTYSTKGSLGTVRFKDGKVRAVILYGAQGDSNNYELQGIRIGDASKQVIGRFGEDAVISSSKDGLKRIYAFPKYQVFFGMDTDKVEIFGIYDPSLPLPVGFTDEEGNK